MKRNWKGILRREFTILLLSVFSSLALGLSIIMALGDLEGERAEISSAWVLGRVAFLLRSGWAFGLYILTQALRCAAYAVKRLAIRSVDSSSPWENSEDQEQPTSGCSADARKVETVGKELR